MVAQIGAAGAVGVIDNSSAFRMDPDVPRSCRKWNADAVRGFYQEEHHRQPELLDRAARGRVKALHDKRPPSGASWSRPISPVSAPAKDAMDELFSADQGRLHQQRLVNKKFPEALSPSTSSPRSTCSWRTATQGRVEDD